MLRRHRGKHRLNQKGISLDVWLLLCFLSVILIFIYILAVSMHRAQLKLWHDTFFQTSYLFGLIASAKFAVLGRAHSDNEPSIRGLKSNVQ